MERRAFETGIDTALADGVVSAVRTSLGDSLRSIVYVTPAAFDVLYVRQGLYSTRDATRRAEARLAAFEQAVIDDSPADDARARAASDPIGGYEFTIRVHGEGFVVRVLVGEQGVLFTTDEMEIEAFDDAASALRHLLEAA